MFVSAALTGTQGHPPGEVVIMFIPGLFQQELPRRSLVTASPRVSLVSRLGSEGGGATVQLRRGTNSWLLPRREENTANVNL